MRSVKEAQLVDRMPSQFEDWWLALLLCEGGSRVEMVSVIVCNHGRTKGWDPWLLSTKKLLLVSE